MSEHDTAPQGASPMSEPSLVSELINIVLPLKLSATAEPRLLGALVQDWLMFDQASRNVRTAGKRLRVKLTAGLVEGMALRLAPPQPIITHVQALTGWTRTKVLDRLRMASAFSTISGAATDDQAGVWAAGMTPPPVWLLVSPDGARSSSAALEAGSESTRSDTFRSLEQLIRDLGGIQLNSTAPGGVVRRLFERCVDCVYVEQDDTTAVQELSEEVGRYFPWISLICAVPDPGALRARPLSLFGVTEIQPAEYAILVREARGRLRQWSVGTLSEAVGVDVRLRLEPRHAGDTSRSTSEGKARPIGDTAVEEDSE